MVSYQYKLYTTKNTVHLEKMLAEACFVWNHALALQKRYHRLYKKYITSSVMQKHFAKRVKRTYLHSQSTQEVLQRLDAAYQRFFKHIATRPPKFKKRKDFTSFCYKQGGFVLSGNVFHVNSIKKDFKFSYSRPYDGKVKQVRVRRSPRNEWYIYVVTDAVPKSYTKTHDGASAGMDFGLKTYLTTSDGEKIDNPQFLKKDLSRLRKASRKYSKCKDGSNHKESARMELTKVYEDITNKRNDFQWKLAHELCKRYDVLFIEDLNLSGMTKLWGRKMSDLAHGSFVQKLVEVAAKYGCTVHKIDRWFPSSKLCDCGYKNNSLQLYERTWTCPECGQIHDRDVHAAEMILRRGVYELTSNSKTCEPLGFWAVASESRISRL